VPDDPASVSSPARLEPARQLVGNNDEVTDLRFVGSPAAPTHVAVATNSEQVGLCLCARSRCAVPGRAVCCRRCCCREGQGGGGQHHALLCGEGRATKQT